jgi:hypothetical protein
MACSNTCCGSHTGHLPCGCTSLLLSGSPHWWWSGCSKRGPSPVKNSSEDAEFPGSPHGRSRQVGTFQRTIQSDIPGCFPAAYAGNPTGYGTPTSLPPPSQHAPQYRRRRGNAAELFLCAFVTIARFKRHAIVGRRHRHSHRGIFCLRFIRSRHRETSEHGLQPRDWAPERERDGLDRFVYGPCRCTHTDHPIA